MKVTEVALINCVALTECQGNDTFLLVSLLNVQSMPSFVPGNMVEMEESWAAGVGNSQSSGKEKRLTGSNVLHWSVVWYLLGTSGPQLTWL